MSIKTIREEVFERFEGLQELVEKTFPTDPRGVHAFNYSLELFIRRTIPTLGSIDGWSYLNIVEETNKRLHIIGLMYVVPCMSQIPLEAEFLLDDSKLDYSYVAGINDKSWKVVPGSKKSNAVELYALNHNKIQWEWGDRIIGTLDE
jgi:hypothetical protein